MASTGFKFAGTGSSLNTGEDVWSFPERVTADDNSYAMTPDNMSVTSDRLLGSNFDFSAIPDGSTIDGVEFRYRRKAGAIGVALDSTHVRLYSAGSPIGTAKDSAAAWEGTETATTLGGAADLWGATLTTAIVKASTFGGAIDVDWGATGFPAGGTLDVDSIEMNVHYTAPAGSIPSGLLLMGCGD